MSTNPPRDGTKPSTRVKRSTRSMRGRSQTADDAGATREFHPGTALEDLRCRIVDLEALAHSARQAADRIPFVPDPALRRILARAQALIIAAAGVAEVVLDEADELISRLQRH
jgi:hypothetical protein